MCLGGSKSRWYFLTVVFFNLADSVLDAWAPEPTDHAGQEVGVEGGLSKSKVGEG